MQFGPSDLSRVPFALVRNGAEKVHFRSTMRWSFTSMFRLTLKFEIQSEKTIPSQTSSSPLSRNRRC